MKRLNHLPVSLDKDKARKKKADRQFPEKEDVGNLSKQAGGSDLSRKDCASYFVKGTSDAVSGGDPKKGHLLSVDRGKKKTPWFRGEKEQQKRTVELKKGKRGVRGPPDGGLFGASPQTLLGFAAQRRDILGPDWPVRWGDGCSSAGKTGKKTGKKEKGKNDVAHLTGM